MSSHPDPTKAELLAAVAAAFPASMYPGVAEYCGSPDYDNFDGHLDGSEFLAAAFDIEAAIYLFASNWHSGMGSNLYSVLSTSEFHFGSCVGGPEEDSAEEEIFNFLESHYFPETYADLKEKNK